MKNTKQRTLILDILKKAKKPLSASDIFNKIAFSNKPIALTTIYRNLDILYENDLVSKFRLAKTEYSYELKKEKHTHYLICKSCKRRVEISDCPLKELEKKIKDETGFSITSHNLELEGYCDKCKK